MKKRVPPYAGLIYLTVGGKQDEKLPPYAGLVLKHIRAVGVKPGRNIEVRHDDWCAFWKTDDARDCNCNPAVVSGPHVQRKYGIDGGSNGR